jgi:hypothetical protein
MIEAVMYGVTPSANTEIGAEVTAGEEVEHAEQSSGNVAPNFLETSVVDTGGGDVGAEAIDGEKSQRKENAPA